MELRAGQWMNHSYPESIPPHDHHLGTAAFAKLMSIIRAQLAGEVPVVQEASGNTRCVSDTCEAKSSTMAPSEGSCAAASDEEPRNRTSSCTYA